jgi:hypothetical protein
MMRKNNKGNLLEGLVVDNNDPQQMGRLKVWVPSLDGDSYEIQNLPWVYYMSPLAGQTLDFVQGETASKTEGYKSFGFWAIPKIGNIVIVGLLHNDSNLRFYMGSLFGEHGNRSLPNGRNRPDITSGPLSDTYEPIQPHFENLKMQFNGKLDSSEAKTRGAYERAVAQDKTVKDGKEGYQNSTITKDKLEPQTYCFVSPGGNSVIFQDNPENSRVRIKSSSGHQIIMDDANERIYISTSRGNNYIELDTDGRIHIFSNNDIALTTEGNLDFTVGKSFSVNAKEINLSAREKFNILACDDFNLKSDKNIKVLSGIDCDMKSKAEFTISSSKLYLNSKSKPAKEADCPNKPTVVPEHEPWTRAASKVKRNKNWKA